MVDGGEMLHDHEVVIATRYILISTGTELAHYRGRSGQVFLAYAGPGFPL